MTLLTLEKATVTYDGNAVLRDVTLSIEQGERIAARASAVGIS
jgi:ABC-type molybdenum transport system ATPase subunit/photorepair protein PhrA